MEHFVGEIILLSVRWYLKYPITYFSIFKVAFNYN